MLPDAVITASKNNKKKKDEREAIKSLKTHTQLELLPFLDT